MNEIERLQEHLLLVRRTVGWTAEEFGLYAEMNQYPEETEMLKLILDVFIDNPESYSEEEKEKLLSKANMVAPSILAGSTSRKDVSKEMVAVAGGLGILAAAGPMFAPAAIIGGATSAWLLKTIFDKKK